MKLPTIIIAPEGGYTVKPDKGFGSWYPVLEDAVTSLIKDIRPDFQVVEGIDDIEKMQSVINLLQIAITNGVEKLNSEITQ